MERFWQVAADVVGKMAMQTPMTLEQVVTATRVMAHNLYQLSTIPPEQFAEFISAPINSSSTHTTGVPAMMNAEEAIREDKIICLECGESFEVLNKKHLAKHDMTPEEYRQKHGYKASDSLMCHRLIREKSAKMKQKMDKEETYALKNNLTPTDGVQDEYIICMECGKQYQNLTSAHLKHHGLTPLAYKERWGYPSDMALMSKNYYKSKVEHITTQGK